MLNRHVSRQLARYVDGDLEPARSRAVEAHLATCPKCRTALEEFRFAAGLVGQLAAVSPPASVWSSIEGALADEARRPPVWSRFSLARLAFACALFAAAIAGGLYALRNGAPATSDAVATWEVVRTGGGQTARMAPGEIVRTDQSSRATIKVGQLGVVDVAPDTSVRLGQVRPAEFRIALERGTISATITAPPRLFIVDTPTSTVVDLGCAYTMHVRDDGGGELRVTEGWTALEWKGRESLVPAGANAKTRPQVGPGTPYFADATVRLQEALDAFDFEAGGAAAVRIVISESRARDTLTLWHLISRVDAGQRASVFDRIAELTPPPATVSRDKALQLDAATLKHWREELAWSW